MFSRIIATAALALSATGLCAEGFEKYGQVGEWIVFADKTKKSCLIETLDAELNVIQMGLTDDRDVAYIGVFTLAETDLKPGSKQEVAIVLGPNIYTGEATAMRSEKTEGYSGGYVLTNDPKVFDDIAKQFTMIVFPQKSYAFSIDLTGTMKALDMARECTVAQTG